MLATSREVKQACSDRVIGRSSSGGIASIRTPVPAPAPVPIPVPAPVPFPLPYPPPEGPRNCG
jgi:hypothetical protein